MREIAGFTVRSCANNSNLWGSHKLRTWLVLVQIVSRRMSRRRRLSLPNLWGIVDRCSAGSRWACHTMGWRTLRSTRHRLHHRRPQHRVSIIVMQHSMQLNMSWLKKSRRRLLVAHIFVFASYHSILGGSRRTLGGIGTSCPSLGCRLSHRSVVRRDMLLVATRGRVLAVTRLV